jgi:hypothetical protein
MPIEVRVSQVHPQKRYKRKRGNEHPSQQALLAVIKGNYVLAGLSVHGPEDLIGAQHRYFPAINPRVPLCSGATSVLTKGGAVAVHEGSQQKE